jgi:predicted HTH transcriptional regulator
LGELTKALTKLTKVPTELTKLKKLGIVERMGTSQNGHWKINSSF